MEESILFSEYIAQEHFRLKDIRNKICYWVNADGVEKTSAELYADFKEEQRKQWQ